MGRVVVGKALEMRENATDRTNVPPPYHSLVGKPGRRLNYEETVVYSNDAIRPAYLIVYGETAASSQSFFSRLFNTPLA